ncbi:unnamed protein product [Ascophyllum nodosum]
MAMVALLSTATLAFPAFPATGARQSMGHSLIMAGSSDRGGGDTSSAVCRRDAFKAFLGVAASPLLFSTTANAKDDPALKGTKEDPDFVKCVSDCVYFCTKQKQPAKSRTECIPECRKSCAKTKAQQLVGRPRE